MSHMSPPRFFRRGRDETTALGWMVATFRTSKFVEDGGQMLRRFLEGFVIASLAMMIGCGSSVESGTPGDAGLSGDGSVGSDAGATSDAPSEPIPPITVTLAASKTQVTSAGSITLTATAMADRATVGKIEFYDGET